MRRLAAAVPLIDVRSPGEYARGFAPFAANAALLDDRERHQVGLRYKEQGARRAVHLGLEIFAAKAESYLAQVDGIACGGRKIAVHCARGGMRSRLVGLWLANAGYDVLLVEGGYKSYRQTVLETLDELAERELLVLDGCTGAGKSELLQTLVDDVPLIDFEGHARHRGSAFGDFAQTEPVATQQQFENEVAERYLALGRPGRLLVEIENFIGPIILPQKLRDKVFSSPIILVSREFDDRVERLARIYVGHWNDDTQALFEERCEMLRRHMPREALGRIIQAGRDRNFKCAVELLLELRYDKVYKKGIERRLGQVIAEFNLTHAEAAARAFILDRLGVVKSP